LETLALGGYVLVLAYLAVTVPVDTMKLLVRLVVQILEVNRCVLLRRHRRRTFGRDGELVREGAIEFIMRDLAVLVDVELAKKPVGQTPLPGIGWRVEAARFRGRLGAVPHLRDRDPGADGECCTKKQAV